MQSGALRGYAFGFPWLQESPLRQGNGVYEVVSLERSPIFGPAPARPSSRFAITDQITLSGRLSAQTEKSNPFATLTYNRRKVTGKPAAAPDEAKHAEPDKTEDKNGNENRKTENKADKGPFDKLDPEEQREVNELKQRDAEVKAHEQAHIAAGGPYIRGGANYKYKRGPDNRNYAVGGEVSIDVSPERTPEATIRKMQIVRRAALAPRDPSGQDRAVAAQAAQIEAKARQELQKQKREESQEKREKDKTEMAAAAKSSGQQSFPYRGDTVSTVANKVQDPQNNRSRQLGNTGNRSDQSDVSPQRKYRNPAVDTSTFVFYRSSLNPRTTASANIFSVTA